MGEIIKTETLKDIVNRENAASEEVKQNEIAALREKIDEYKREKERLQQLNSKKKKAIIILSICLGIFVLLSGAMLANFLLYDNVFTADNTVTDTVTESITEENQDEILTKADNNDSDAQLAMGMRYFAGADGYQKDKQQALEWFTRSSNNGNIKAMKLLAAMYEQGDGTEKNNQSAFRYYFMAAGLDDKEALYKVGKFYYGGTGVEKNNEKALLYLGKSAKQDYQPAITLINIIKQENAAAQPIGNSSENDNKKDTETLTNN